MYSDADVVRFIGNQLWVSVDKTRELLERIVEHPPAMPKGMGWFPVDLRATGALVGAAIIRPPSADSNRTDPVIEIGWHLARAHWGNGYATEAGNGLLEWGFTVLDLDRLDAIVEEPNTASHAVARRLGMLDQGLTDAYSGRVMRHYTLNREDWLARGLPRVLSSTT